jgi:ice-binding like protein
MNRGVPQQHRSLAGDSLAVRSVSRSQRRAKSFRLSGLLAGGLLAGMLFASAAVAAPATVGLGTAASYSVLAGSTVTNTGPTTMFGDLGLAPGSSVTGAPHVLGQTHVDDAVAIEAKLDLTTAYNAAASRPTEGSAGTDLAGQTFTPGVRTASGALLLSAGSVVLDAQGDPNAVFIFQIGSTLITGSNTTVQLVNGAQACNVFWQVGSSATLGTGTRFVGTVMAAETITANTAATIHGRLLAQTAAVNMDTNTITQSNCASSGSGLGGGGETTTSEEGSALQVAIAAAEATTTTNTTVGASAPAVTVAAAVTAAAVIAPKPATSATQAAAQAAARRAAAKRAAHRRAVRRRAAAARRRHRAEVTRRTQARPPSPNVRGAFTG